MSGKKGNNDSVDLDIGALFGYLWISQCPTWSCRRDRLQYSKQKKQVDLDLYGAVQRLKDQAENTERVRNGPQNG